MKSKISKWQLVQSWVLLAQRIEAGKNPLSVFESLGKGGQTAFSVIHLFE